MRPKALVLIVLAAVALALGAHEPIVQIRKASAQEPPATPPLIANRYQELVTRIQRLEADQATARQWIRTLAAEIETLKGAGVPKVPAAPASGGHRR
jgi:hypothetical protein